MIDSVVDGVVAIGFPGVAADSTIVAGLTLEVIGLVACAAVMGEGDGPAAVVVN